MVASSGPALARFERHSRALNQSTLQKCKRRSFVAHRKILLTRAGGGELLGDRDPSNFVVMTCFFRARICGTREPYLVGLASTRRKYFYYTSPNRAGGLEIRMSLFMASSLLL
jgi:hypothetical protein